jgi:subtilisin family serine protease
VDVEHPDLNGRVVQTVNFVEGGERTFNQDSHGTAVIGVIAAKADNHIGIFGIAPDAEIVAVKACWQRAPGVVEAVCSSWTLAKAVDYAIGAGVRVLNLSLTGPPDPLLARLITRAVEGGITAVAAAVEGGEQAPGFPASLATVLGVLASDVHGEVRGAAPVERTGLLAAPGVEILTTMPHQSFDFLSGSSLAAAHVSGITALLLEVDPRLSPPQVHALFHAATQPAEATYRTSQPVIGLVDACTALEKLFGRPTCP